MSYPDIIGLIDNAIEDWETSDDAMRWTPDPPTGPRRPTDQHINADGFVALTPAQIESIHTYMRETAAAYSAAIMQAWEAYKPAIEHLGKVVVDLTEVLEGIDGTGPATPAAVSPRVPAYQDARPRWQSPYGPAKRR